MASPEARHLQSVVCAAEGGTELRIKEQGECKEVSCTGEQWRTVDQVLGAEAQGSREDRLDAIRTECIAVVGIPMLNSFVNGYNTCCFSFGQPVCGQDEVLKGDAQNPGLIRYITLQLLRQLSEAPHKQSNVQHVLQISLFEINQEGNAKDLLLPNNHSFKEYTVWQDPLRDGLVEAQVNKDVDRAKLLQLRALVKENTLTYLMCESLGGNCVTTALGFIDATLVPKAARTLDFAERVRALTGTVRANYSDHDTAVTEIERQISQAEARNRKGSDLASVDWESNIQLRQEAIQAGLKAHAAGALALSQEYEAQEAQMTREGKEREGITLEEARQRQATEALAQMKEDKERRLALALAALALKKETPGPPGCDVLM
eukprot:gene22841-35003_t